jgi:hypothetical protein
MRSYRADDPAILALKSGLPPAPAPGAKPTVRVEILSAQQAAALEARPAVEAVTLDTSNNRPVHLRQSEPQRRSASVVTLFPHVNGDGSVRLQVSVQGIVPLPGIPRGLPEVVTGALARVSSESTLLLMPDSSENVLMVRVVVVAPPMAEAAKPE